MEDMNAMPLVTFDHIMEEWREARAGWNLVLGGEHLIGRNP